MDRYIIIDLNNKAVRRNNAVLIFDSESGARNWLSAWCGKPMRMSMIPSYEKFHKYSRNK